LLAFLLAGASATGGPLVPDELFPLDPQFCALGPLRPYYATVRQHLIGANAATSSAIVVPSFREEWAVQVAFDRGDPFILYSILDVGLWGTMQQHATERRLWDPDVLREMRISVSRRSASLSRETAARLEAAWMAVLPTARLPREARRTIDGTSYIFLSKDGATTVMARSPRPGTLSAALADLVGALRDHALAPPSGRADTERAVLRLATTVVDVAGSEAPSVAPHNEMQPTK
jgi:hypothetical protein